MQLYNRVKCSASLTSMALTVGDPLPGFQYLPTDRSTPVLVEHSSGMWMLAVATHGSDGVWSLQPLQNSSPGLSGNEGAVTLSVVAPLSTYVAIGGSADVVSSALGDYSVAVGGGTAGGEYSVAVGVSAQTPSALAAVALGSTASAEAAGSTALGSKAKAMHAGEVALGNRFGPNLSVIPVRADSGTVSPVTLGTAGETGDYFSVSSVPTMQYGILAQMGNHYKWVGRVTGTIVVTSSDGARVVLSVNCTLSTQPWPGEILSSVVTVISSSGGMTASFGFTPEGVPQVSAAGIGVATFEATGLLTLEKIPY